MSAADRGPQRIQETCVRGLEQDERPLVFTWLRNKRLRKLRESYRRSLEYARDLQRSGDIQGHAAAMTEAEALGRRIDEIEGGSSDSGAASREGSS